MSEGESRATDYLGHILQAIDRIESYTTGLTERGFLESRITQDAVIRDFEVIGEASRNLERHCPNFVATHQELPVRAANEMRSALAHGYFQVDLGIVWKTPSNDLQPLRQQIKEALKGMSRGPEAAAETQNQRKSVDERNDSQASDDDLAL